jgi:hypothetical protein
MHEIINTNADAMTAELSYRRSLLIGTRSTPHSLRSRRWRRNVLRPS